MVTYRSDWRAHVGCRYKKKKKKSRMKGPKDEMLRHSSFTTNFRIMFFTHKGARIRCLDQYLDIYVFEHRLYHDLVAVGVIMVYFIWMPCTCAHPQPRRCLLSKGLVWNDSYANGSWVMLLLGYLLPCQRIFVKMQQAAEWGWFDFTWLAFIF